MSETVWETWRLREYIALAPMQNSWTPIRHTFFQFQLSLVKKYFQSCDVWCYTCRSSWALPPLFVPCLPYLSALLLLRALRALLSILLMGASSRVEGTRVKGSTLGAWWTGWTDWTGWTGGLRSVEGIRVTGSTLGGQSSENHLLACWWLLAVGWFHIKAPRKTWQFFFWIFDQKSQKFLIF